MTRRDLFSVAVIFTGFWSVLRGLILTPGAITRSQVYLAMPQYSEANALGVWFSQLSHPVIHLVAGAILLFWGEAVSARLIRDDRPIAFEATGQWEEPLFILALRVTGVVWVVSWIPYLVSLVTTDLYRNLKAYQTPEWDKLIGGVLVLAVSAYLITGAKHLVQFIFRNQDPAAPSGNAVEP